MVDTSSGGPPTGNGAPASGILQGQTGNPALDSISEALNNALNSTNVGNSASYGMLQTGLSQGLQYLNTYLNQANAAISPQTQASYSALDSYLGALGIPGFSQGAAAYASTQKQLAPLLSQQQNLQSQYDSAEQQWQGLHSAGLAGKIPKDQYETAAQALSSTLTSLQSQLTPLNAQITSLQGSSANQMQTSGSVPNALENMKQNDPGYQLRLDTGSQALQQSALQNGTLNTSGTQQNLIQYGQNYASNEYNNYVSQRQGAALGLAPAATQTSNQTAGAGNTATAAQLSVSGQQAANQFATGTNQANAYIGAGSALSAIYQGIQQQNAATGAAAQGAQAYSTGFSSGGGN